MSIATRVYLVRHGQTALNAEGRLRGFIDPPLNETGFAEVAETGSELAAFKPAMVLSSPMQRAIETSQAIGNAAGIPVRVEPRLNGRDYGPQAGRFVADVEKEFGSVDQAPGVEPIETFLKRVRRAFFELIVEFGPGPLVMVSHDAFNLTLVKQLDPSLTHVWLPHLETASWSQLSLVDGVWHVDSLNCKPARVK